VHRFIDPANRPKILSLTRSTDSIDPQNVLRDSLPSISTKFIPLKDILTKGYEAKVQEYMDQMKDQTIADVLKIEQHKDPIMTRNTKKLKPFSTLN
jgi:hypothetical protein